MTADSFLLRFKSSERIPLALFESLIAQLMSRPQQVKHAPEREGTMSAQGLEVIDHTVQLTHEWINELRDRLAWEQQSRCPASAARDNGANSRSPAT
ncbi:hypothetical protein [Falsihalocynthiibacter arcticus]|uniref:hypothetical protein n=1 Tax=Falsihalocynthiibacter arcticus TaxID=1579316 RepID=UPI0012E7B7AA|nr:hypothetical protein [Falsihalocynthiibacter arcticus]